MAVPAISGVSSGHNGGAGNTVIVSHTADGGPVYFIVTGRTYSGSNGSDDFAVTADIDGVDMVRRVSWFSAGAVDIMRVWLFTLPSVAAGAKTITFTAPVLSGVEEYSGIAFNLANGPVHAGVVLPGGYYNFSNATSLTKTAYGWATDGLQCTLAWGRQ